MSRPEDTFPPNSVPSQTPVEICGLSGRFPESSSASELFCNLVAGRDLVTDDERKWPHFLFPELPKRNGKIKAGELSAFDAQFFGVHGQQARKMDPQLYKLLEVSWEAWVDSGIDVRALRDSNRVGVYTGICGSEVHSYLLADINEVTGYEQTGCTMSMAANRLSYFYSFRGPSKTCDTACSSAAYSLHDAISDITADRIDYAVVLGAAYLMSPNMSLAFNRLHMLSPEGACKAFDAAGNGYVRSEGIAALILKRSDLANVPQWASTVPYCTIMNIGINNDGFTEEGITFPNRLAQLALEKQVCKSANINPADVSYVEAHGTGTVAGDGQELDAINRCYGTAPGRTKPLLIGSVKSNIGHCEGASCMASLVKVCLSMEYGVLPGNLHYHRDTPNPDSEGLRTGTLQVVDETQRWDGGYAAISSFGFGGANMHLVMKGRGGERIQLQTVVGGPSDSTDEDEDFSPEPGVDASITPLAARTPEGLVYLAKIVSEAEIAEKASFVQPLRRYANVSAHDMRLNHRGTLVNGKLRAGVGLQNQPPVWYVFSGNGSQWPQMGLSLLESNRTFRDSILACAQVVEPMGIDLVGAFHAEKGWKTPLLGAVGLLALQIGLVDVLREEYGIMPTGMLGHSAGEIACTYASGCCTKEQAMLIAYHRGRLPVEHNVSDGLMAATGLPAAEAARRTAGTGVVLACDNSPKSTTLSGPASAVRKFQAMLEAEGVFNRALDTNGVPYHSPALRPLLSELCQALKQAIPNPAERPDNWFSTAYPADSTDYHAGMCSAEYQVHSYVNPVRFTDAVMRIPDNVLLVEIGPHSILRSPVRQCRPALPYLSMMAKGQCAVQTLANAVSDMWSQGVSVQWQATPVPDSCAGSELPRSVREALVSWDRQQFDTPVAMAWPSGPGIRYERVFDLGGKDAYLCDHAIDGNVFIPLSCFLVLAWEAYALWHRKTYWELPVEFTDISVYMPVQAPRGGKISLGVTFDYSYKFQVLNGLEVICDGTLRSYDQDQLAKEILPMRYCQQMNRPPKEWTGVSPQEFDHLATEEFYALTERQNVQYGPHFQMVTKYAVDKSWFEIRWKKNWTIHLDGLFQTFDRLGDHNVHVARGMRRLAIVDTMVDVEDGFLDHIDMDTYWKVSRSSSVILEGYKDEIAQSKHKPARRVIINNKWLPYGERPSDDKERAEYGTNLLQLVKSAIDTSGGDSGVRKIAGAVARMGLQPLTQAAREALVQAEDNLLAKMLNEHLVDDAMVEQGIATQHSSYAAALEKDMLLSVDSQIDLDAMLALAIANQPQSGYTVAEVGAGNGALTKQALLTCIKMPQSSLLSYTAMDKAETSDITRAIQHRAIRYQAYDINNPKAARPGSFNILVARHLSHTANDLPRTLATLFESLQEGGFLMLQELLGPVGALALGTADRGDGRLFGACTSLEHWHSLLTGAGFDVMTTVRCPSGCRASFLCRKLPPVRTHAKEVLLAGPKLHATEAEMDQWLSSYRDALDEVTADEENPGLVWLYGDFVKQPGLIGFLSSARKEFGGDFVRAIIGWDTPNIDYQQCLEDVRHLDMVLAVFKQGKLGVYAGLETLEYKHQKAEQDTPYGAHLNFTKYGNLKSAVWRENAPFSSRSGLIKCNVAYGSLNFRDVMLAYGKLSKQQMAHESGGDNIGFEFSGTSDGRRVMGSAASAIATKLQTRADLVWEVPEGWSLAEAATVPTAYMTAYYSLVMRGRLSRGMRVLIHAGTGAVGLAAIQLCLQRGAEVFATVGSPAKRKFLLDTFPQLQEDHIGDSRSTTFEGLVRNVTRGKGVHLVLNSLSSEKLQASVRCLGHWGKLLEIGKYDILQGTPLSMRPMLNNISFEGIDVDRVMNHPESTELAELNQLVSDGLASGEVRPLPINVFPRTDIEEAFRFMASGKHIGKVLIDTSAFPQLPSTSHCLGPKAPLELSAAGRELPSLELEPMLHCSPDKSYIVTGGLGGFGMAFAEHLGNLGAKHIVLTSKRGVRSGGQQAALQKLFSKNINIRVSTLDVGIAEEAEALVDLAESLAPVGGIFHLALTLADKLLHNQNGQSWNQVMHAKAHGGYNLDRASRRLKDLDHFVLWSSMVAGAGNEGQTNYGFANACLDALSEARRAEGLPSISIQWGVIDHVGVADKAIQELMESGLLAASLPQPIDDCLQVLSTLMLEGNKVTPVMASSWQPMDILGKSSGNDSKKDLLGNILSVMGLSVAKVTNTDTLARLGIDSMQEVEVRSNLQRALGRPVALGDVRTMTIAAIKAIEGVEEEEESTDADSTTEAGSEGQAGTGMKSVPVFQPAKLVDLARDYPSNAARPPKFIRARHEKAGGKPRRRPKHGSQSSSSVSPPCTPEHVESDIEDARSSSSGASAISIPPSSGLAHIPEQGMASAANKAAAEA